MNDRPRRGLDWLLVLGLKRPGLAERVDRTDQAMTDLEERERQRLEPIETPKHEQTTD